MDKKKVNGSGNGNAAKGSNDWRVKVGLAEMLKGGVIMDVTNAEQARIAKAYIAQLNQARTFDAAIVTKIEPGKTFYPAEGYHQDYLTLNPTQPYIAINDLPKIDELKRLFPSAYRPDPVLVAAAQPAG